MHAPISATGTTVRPWFQSLFNVHSAGNLVRLRCVLLTLTAAVLVSACGGSSDETERAFSGNPATTPVPTVTVAPTPEPTAPTATPTATATPTVTVAPTPTASPVPTATASPAPTVTATPTPEPTPVALATLQSEIFTPRCSSCHKNGGRAASTGLFLDSVANSFSRLVGVTSTGSPGRTRVIANDSANSYLIDKLLGSPGIAGARMPLNNTPLNAEQMASVRSWIDGGALQMNASATQVLQAKMIPTELGPRFVLKTSRPLDAASLSEGAVLVYGNQDNQRQLLPSELVKVSASGAELVVDISDPAAQFDSLELELNNPALSGVLDDLGRLLDGDGNNEDGGVYIFKP